MDRNRFDDLKEAYALGALAEEERREFEAYLENHPDLQAEVEDLNAVAGLLALSPAEHEPPPELRRRLMRAVESEAARPSGRADRPPFFSRLRAAFGPRGLALGAAGLVLAALLSWNMLLQGEVRELRGEVEEQRSYAMEGSGPAADARAEVLRTADGRAVLLAENLPPVGEDQTCQIWVIEDGTPRSAGTFSPKDGPVAASVEGSLQGAETVAVTIEPAGGSPEPTGDPVLSAEL